MLAPAESAPFQPIYVIFTVDVESRSDGNPDRDIWGKLPDHPGDHGIVRMMDIFDKHDLKATFFVNIYEAPTHGEEALAEVCRTISDRNHDLQLHTHPKPMFGVWGMYQADLDTQVKILRRGKELIKKWAGRDVVAHRAGAYAANLDTIAACKKADIPVDFSLNIAWPHCPLIEADLTQNAAVNKDGVLCVPVTAYAQVQAGSWKSLRFLDLESSSHAEFAEVISRLHTQGVRTAVVMMHSFSFSRFDKPNYRVENLLDRLLADLQANPDVRVVTAEQLHKTWLANPDAVIGPDYLPTTGPWMTYCRSWQRLDEGWKNVVVAFAPPGAVIACLCVLLYWRRCRSKRKMSAADAQ